MKTNFDTKIFHAKTFDKLNTEVINKKEILDPIQEQLLLKNIYFRNCLVPLTYLINIENTNDFYFLKNSFVYSVLRKFINNELKITFMLGNNDKESPLFSELKSQDKRIFENYEIYTRLIICNSTSEFEELKIHSQLL